MKPRFLKEEDRKRSRENKIRMLLITLLGAILFVFTFLIIDSAQKEALQLHEEQGPVEPYYNHVDFYKALSNLNESRNRCEIIKENMSSNDDPHGKYKVGNIISVKSTFDITPSRFNEEGFNFYDLDAQCRITVHYKYNVFHNDSETRTFDIGAFRFRSDIKDGRYQLVDGYELTE